MTKEPKKTEAPTKVSEAIAALEKRLTQMGMNGPDWWLPILRATSLGDGIVFPGHECVIIAVELSEVEMCTRKLVEHEWRRKRRGVPGTVNFQTRFAITELGVEVANSFVKNTPDAVAPTTPQPTTSSKASKASPKSPSPTKPEVAENDRAAFAKRRSSFMVGGEPIILPYTRGEAE